MYVSEQSAREGATPIEGIECLSEQAAISEQDAGASEQGISEQAIRISEQAARLIARVCLAIVLVYLLSVLVSEQDARADAFDGRMFDTLTLSEQAYVLNNPCYELIADNPAMVNAHVELKLLAECV